MTNIILIRILLQIQLMHFQYKSTGIDACEPMRSVCDGNSTCEDQPANATASAKCTCADGFEGDGYSPHVTLLDKAGCRDYDGCMPGRIVEETCSPMALCIDLPPPSTTVNCSCPYVCLNMFFTEINKIQFEEVFCC